MVIPMNTGFAHFRYSDYYLQLISPFQVLSFAVKQRPSPGEQGNSPFCDVAFSLLILSLNYPANSIQ
jgi:hypothetical protein